MLSAQALRLLRDFQRIDGSTDSGGDLYYRLPQVFRLCFEKWEIVPAMDPCPFVSRRGLSYSLESWD